MTMNLSAKPQKHRAKRHQPHQADTMLKESTHVNIFMRIKPITGSLNYISVYIVLECSTQRCGNLSFVYHFKRNISFPLLQCKYSNVLKYIVDAYENRMK